MFFIYKRHAIFIYFHIEKISNARIEIGSESEDVSGNIILVGHSQRVKDLSVTVPSGFTFQLNEEGFVIKTVENSLILAGNEDGEYRGTIYAVYAFLEKLGCRWFFPGEFGEVVPEIDTISIDAIDCTERPSFRIRNIWYSGWEKILWCISIARKVIKHERSRSFANFEK